jgi:4a-hydroxytetrahydrobiopterin dehydratase
MGGMDETAHGTRTRLTRTEASELVASLGWRFILGEFRAEVVTGSLPLAADVAARAAAVPGADGHLRMDVRADRVLLSVQTAAVGWVTAHDVELARSISALADGLRLATEAGVGTDPRSVQVIEIGIDALDIPAIRPFWKAVLGYADEPGGSGPTDAVIDPLGQGPAVWFQQMDAPRPQRNRIHFDVAVPHDEAGRRIEAALAAGGTVRSDAQAPAFWVLADPEGNEACVTTWQGRDA